MIHWNSMRTKSVNWNFWETVFWYGLLSNWFPWIKFRGNSLNWKKVLGSQFNRFENNRIEIRPKRFRGRFFQQSSIYGNCLHHGWKKKEKPLHWSLTGNPKETISHECNAKKMVPLKENPPNYSIGNPRKFLSTTKRWWKSIWSEKNLFHNLRWRNFHGKHLLIASPWNKFPLTNIVRKSVEHPKKTSLIWLEAHRNRLHLKAIPSRKKLLRKKSRKTISRTKNAEKLESWKVKRSETKFIEGKNTLT